MNRRESLKALGITSIGTGLLLSGCKTDSKEVSGAGPVSLGDADVTGLEPHEIERIKRIQGERRFFNDHERSTLILLGDMIIPKDDVSGSASDAKVIDFIEFIVKDDPKHQTPLRGGLRWLDLQCLNRYGNSFVECKEPERIELLDEIAFPNKVKPGMEQGTAFFSKVRDLVATGFFTSQIGIKDIGYVGNVPGSWAGVPQEVLKQYNLEDFQNQFDVRYPKETFV